MARLSEHGIRMSSMSPSFLNSNSTSHTWPFSAVAELIDNASDPGVCAKQMWIDVVEESGQLCLTFTDNGCGMTPNKLHKMLSFGFTEKGSSKLHQAIGVYGNGFKSGSMRLGRDALIFTKNGGCQSVGMLSQTYLENIKAQTVVVPIVPLNQQTKSLVVTEDSEASLAAILKHSIVTSVEQICKHFDSMNSKKGTKILIWNLRRAKDGRPEFDFETDGTDIRLPSLQIEELKKGLRNNATIRVEQNVPEMHYSLRAYLSILYLKPRMQIILRGKKTTAKLMSKSLISVEHDVYSPHFSKDKLKVTFGLNSTKKDQCGIMLYHKNRLIKAYEKVGCQLKASGQRAGVGVIGIIECNFLKPAHNKQDFEYTKEYRLTLSALGAKLNDYWKDLTEKQARARAFQGVNRDENEEEHGNNDVPMWLQCEECLKWRSIPPGHYSDVPESWNCSQNPNRRYRSCSAPEEAEDSVELLVPSYHKSHKKKKPRKNKGQESSLEDFEKDQLAEHETSSHSSQKNPPPNTSDRMRSSHRCDAEATADKQKNTFQFEGFEEVHVEDAHTPDDTQTPESCHAESDIQEHAPRSKTDMEDFTCTEPHTHDDAHKKQAFTVRDANSKDKIQEQLVEHERNDPELESLEKPKKKDPNMETMERMSVNTNILSFKRKAESLFSRVKKRPCVWMNQKPDAESMDEEINPEKQTDKTVNLSSEQTKQDRPSQADNAGNSPQRFLASLSRAYSIPSTQTMIVPPLTRTEMPLPPDETDQAVNLQKLTGLEKEVQRLRQILGLQIPKKTQGTMTTADFSAEKSEEGLLTPPGSSREVGCQTEVTASSTSSSSSPKILNELHQRALVVQNTEEKPEQSGPRKKTESQSWMKSSAREVCEDSRSSQESLRGIRNNVVVLLTTLLPQLDLTDISLETTDVDNILQQIIEVNSLNL